jgi:hypothetical protein
VQRQTTDEFAGRLSGQTASVDGASWEIEVYGVVPAGSFRWVQIGLHGPDERAVLVRAPSTADDRETALAIEGWLADQHDDAPCESVLFATAVTAAR